MSTFAKVTTKWTEVEERRIYRGLLCGQSSDEALPFIVSIYNDNEGGSLARFLCDEATLREFWRQLGALLGECK